MRRCRGYTVAAALGSQSVAVVECMCSALAGRDILQSPQAMEDRERGWHLHCAAWLAVVLAVSEHMYVPCERPECERPEFATAVQLA